MTYITVALETELAGLRTLLERSGGSVEYAEASPLGHSIRRKFDGGSVGTVQLWDSRSVDPAKVTLIDDICGLAGVTVFEDVDLALSSIGTASKQERMGGKTVVVRVARSQDLARFKKLADKVDVFRWDDVI
jgi:hypothetical protein